MSGKPRCTRCGDELPGPWFDVTQFGDNEPRYISAFPCNCPQWRCPFCHMPLDRHGRCDHLGCFLVGNIAPLPELA